MIAVAIAYVGSCVLVGCWFIASAIERSREQKP